MRKVLVTGSHGFVGRRFVKYFADCGDEVTCIDNMASGVPTEDWLFKPVKNDRLRIHFADCRQLFHALKPRDFDLVVHCAAIVGGRMRIENDALAIATNLSVDSEMFNWVVRAGRKPKVIYFSSPAAYPLSLQTLTYHQDLAEDDLHFEALTVELPDRTYGFAKLCGEYLARYAREEYGLDVHIYRPFGGYGEDQSLDYPFPSIIRRVVAEEDPVIVWGSGEQCRDFVYIDDVVRCVVATMDEPSGTTLNIGTGLSTSFMNLAKQACKILGKDLLVRNDPDRPEGVFYRVADITAMSRYYVPRVSVADGIERVAHHIRKTLCEKN